MEGERKIRQAQRGQDRRALNVSINGFLYLTIDSWLRLHVRSLGTGRRLQ